MMVCPGRSCPGPCPADDCYLQRANMGYPPMQWPAELGPEPEMSRYVADGLAALMDRKPVEGVTGWGPKADLPPLDE